MLLGALYIVSAVDPARMDADIIVSTLASLKNPTLYYWGQDRLFSLIPMMLLPFRNIEWNLYLNTFFHAAFFSALILIIQQSIDGNRIKTIGTLMATLIVLNYIMPTSELFTFAKHAQPYAASTVFMIAAFWIDSRLTRPENWKKQIAICTVIAIVSLLLNPLTLLFGLGLLLPRSITYPKLHLSAFQDRDGITNLRWLAILFSAFLVAVISKYFYSQSYDITRTTLGVNISYFTPALRITVERLIESFDRNYFAMCAAALGFLTCLYTCLSRLSDFIYNILTEEVLSPKQTAETVASIPLYDAIACAAIVNLLTLIPILSSEWYRLNDYSLRYIFPVYLVIIIGLCRIINFIFSLLLVNSMLSSNIHSARGIRNVGTYMALTSCIVAILISSFRPIAPSLLTYKEFSRVQPAYRDLLNSVQVTDNTFIGGSYWLSWPFKALGLSEGYDIGVITDRSRFDPISRQREDILDDHIRKGEGFTFICLSEGQGISNCESFLKDKIQSISGNFRDWEQNVEGKPITYLIYGEMRSTEMRYESS
ncbi:hypothetical protein KBY58_03995 [Cyanobium sp. HWJ4-Hawea]|uniref:hypothetical protein n=1 Tax=Cyanobium sp. HWJ4-Hawea TaxID=2823713 RepID=UPI0020CC33B3|nr:hypothetical protein [Cyanobium sp. HWJ4-Hawea]MCP9808592.1 hypothetical protein [Cyanobium sp. HWJ4-Hawea]